MSEKKRIWWCQCLDHLVEYHKSIDRAKGILTWSEEKKYPKITSGTASSIKDGLKNLQEVMRRCNLYFEGNEEAQRSLIEASSRALSPSESATLVSKADTLVRMGIVKQCRIENDLWYEATKEEREESMRKLRESFKPRV